MGTTSPHAGQSRSSMVRQLLSTGFLREPGRWICRWLSTGLSADGHHATGVLLRNRAHLADSAGDDSCDSDSVSLPCSRMPFRWMPERRMSHRGLPSLCERTQRSRRQLAASACCPPTSSGFPAAGQPPTDRSSTGGRQWCTEMVPPEFIDGTVRLIVCLRADRAVITGSFD